jgi:hypothetical protein
MTLLEIIVFAGLIQWLHLGIWLTEDPIMLKIPFLLLFIVAPLFPQLDAYSRYQNYKLIKDHLFAHGFQTRILKPFIRSRCQRDAVIVAAEELGLGKECKAHFRKAGYKWYHLLPDFVFKEPATLICSSFWLNTFFAKTYKSKFDFKKMKDLTETHLQVNTTLNILSRQ